MRRAVLERADGAGSSRGGARRGSPSTAMGQGLMGYSPTPPRRLDVARRHLWTIVWQPVGEGVRVGDWAALEHGTYRSSWRARLVAQRVRTSSRTGSSCRALRSSRRASRSKTASHGMRRARWATGRGDSAEPLEASPLPAGMALRATCARDDQVTYEGDVTVGEAGAVTLNLPDDGSTCSLVDPYGNGGLL